jgi:hypothetical protein
MRRRLKMDVLKPSTEWCWPYGPPEVRHPGGSLNSLARALVVADSGALLVYRDWGYVLRWVDGLPRPEDEDAARAIRRYELAPRDQDQAASKADERRSLPGPFFDVVTLTREDRGADLSDADTTSIRDVIWWLLSKAAAALGAIG